MKRVTKRVGIIQKKKKKRAGAKSMTKKKNQKQRKDKYKREERQTVENKCKEKVIIKEKDHLHHNGTSLSCRLLFL